jgi:hypothetical protein
MPLPKKKKKEAEEACLDGPCLLPVSALDPMAFTEWALAAAQPRQHLPRRQKC